MIPPTLLAEAEAAAEAENVTYVNAPGIDPHPLKLPDCVEVDMEKLKPDATPREWWLSPYLKTNDNKYSYVDDREAVDAIHVIEKSAYNKLEKSRDTFVQDYNKWHDYALEYRAERDALSARVAEMQNQVAWANGKFEDHASELAAAKADIDDRMHRELNLRQDWLEARTEIEKANAEIKRLTCLTSEYQVTTYDLVQAQARIAELEKDPMLVYGRKIELLSKTIRDGEAREQKLVAALESCEMRLLFIFANESSPLTGASQTLIDHFRPAYEKASAALKDFKGGGR